MIPVAVFREFAAKTRRKLAVSCRNPPGNVRNSTLESGNRSRLPVFTGSCRFPTEPEKSGHRIRSLEYCYHEISGIQQNRQFPCRIARPGMLIFLLVVALIKYRFQNESFIFFSCMILLTEWSKSKRKPI